MTNLFVVGSIALDTIKTPDAEVENVLGGSAVYFAWAASYFSEVGIVGVVGRDFPEEYLKLLKTRPINLDGLKITDGKTFHWVGKYKENPNDRETLSVCPNVFKDFVPELPMEYRHSDYVFLANIDPDLHLKVLSQVKKPELVAGDTMDIWIETKRPALLETLKNIDMMILNDSEARQLTHENNLIKAGHIILSLGPGVVIIKKGENGALLIGENILFSIPAYPRETVCDPTGAGDAFAGGVIGFLARENVLSDGNLRKAVIYGSVIASFCIEDFSLNRLKSVSKEDIMRRFQEFRRLTEF